MIPTKVFFTKGVGKHKEKLHSFEMALKAAGVQHCNLVSVSSILPPGCKIISRKQGVSELNPGQITFVVMARMETNEPNRLLAASIGAAIPADPTQYGYLSEHHSFGEKERIAGDYAEDLAATMLASTMGLDIDPDKSYDEQREQWKIQGKIVKTSNITQSAVADKNGLWTTVIAVAVFVIDAGKTQDITGLSAQTEQLASNLEQLNKKIELIEKSADSSNPLNNNSTEPSAQ